MLKKIWAFLNPPQPRLSNFALIKSKIDLARSSYTRGYDLALTDLIRVNLFDKGIEPSDKMIADYIHLLDVSDDFKRFVTSRRLIYEPMRVGYISGTDSGVMITPERFQVIYDNMLKVRSRFVKDIERDVQIETYFDATIGQDMQMFEALQLELHLV